MTECQNAEVILLSVGHSNHDLDRFLALLRAAGVTAIADVRSRPYSRRLSHFSRPELELALKEAGLAYAFLGHQLGGRPDSPDLYYPDGLVDYEQVRTTEAFQRGLDRLYQATEKFRVAMLCAEEDPLDCHRGLMITPALVERGVQPGHLRKDGRIESTPEMEARLLAETGVGGGMLGGLFAAMISDEDRRRLVAEAYRAMARRKGFRLRAGDDSLSTNHGGE